MDHPLSKLLQNKLQKQEALLTAAFALFTENGITETSISSIVEKAGVAKGTFYLYFKDKYDIRDRLIRQKAGFILSNALNELNTSSGVSLSLEDQLVFLCDNIINQLTSDKILTRFIMKNLSWGIIKKDLENVQLHPMASQKEDQSPDSLPNSDLDIWSLYDAALERSDIKYSNPKIMLYLIMEFVSASCCNSILESEPLPIDELRQYVLDGVRGIIRSRQI